MSNGERDKGSVRLEARMDDLMERVDAAQGREEEALRRLNGMTMPVRTRTRGADADEGLPEPRQPRARFKHEDGSDYPDWEPMSLGDVLVERDERCSPEDGLDRLAAVRFEVIRTSDDERSRPPRHRNEELKVTHEGDICISPATFEGGGIGLNRIGTGAMGRWNMTYRVRDGHLPEFVELMLMRPDFLEWVRELTHDEDDPLPLSPHADRFLGLVVSVPSIDEQRRIMELFGTLDSLISATEDEVSAIFSLTDPLTQAAMELAHEDRASADGASPLPKGSKALEGMYLSDADEGGMGDGELLALDRLELCVADDGDDGTPATRGKAAGARVVGTSQAIRIGYANGAVAIRSGDPATLHIRRLLMGYGHRLATEGDAGGDDARGNDRILRVMQATDWSLPHARYDLRRYKGLRDGLLRKMFV